MTAKFYHETLPAAQQVTAPDGSTVSLLCALSGGSMAHFSLGPNETSTAIVHKTVNEIWYFLSGKGQMWRSSDSQEEVIDVHAGVSLTIPVDTAFQFRSTSGEPLEALGQTMPPWPGDDEWAMAAGIWKPTVGAAVAD